MRTFYDYIKSEGSQSPRDIEIHKSIMNLFAKNPSPSDEDVHELAERLDIDPDKLEEYIYKILGKLLSK